MPAFDNPTSPDEQRIREALHHVIDPEVGVNIVDLGLVYGIAIADHRVRVTMTMTTPACPLGEHLRQEVETIVLSRCPGTEGVDVELVWEPPWTPQRISAEARKMLGW